MRLGRRGSRLSTTAIVLTHAVAAALYLLGLATSVTILAAVAFGTSTCPTTDPTPPSLTPFRAWALGLAAGLMAICLAAVFVLVSGQARRKHWLPWAAMAVTSVAAGTVIAATASQSYWCF